MQEVTLTTRRKETILVITDWFYPGFKAGGPIRSCYNLVTQLSNDFDVFVYTSDTDHGDAAPYPDISSDKWLTNIVENARIYYASKSKFSLGKFSREICGLNADVVYLNHMFSPVYVIFPLYLKWRGKLKSKVVLCPRGALYDSALAIKPAKKKIFLQVFKWLSIDKLIDFHATNDREKASILALFPKAKVVVADNLPAAVQPSFKGLAKTSGSLKAIYVARIHPIKNLLLLLQIMKNISTGNIELTIVGPVEDKNYWKLCEEVIKALPINIEVKFLGAVSNTEIQELIIANHLSVLLTEGENFGHSIFESLLAGRPVLISDQTPWQLLYENRLGWEVPLTNVGLIQEKLAQAIQWNQQDFDIFSRASWQFANTFINNRDKLAPYYPLFLYDKESSR